MRLTSVESRVTSLRRLISWCLYGFHGDSSGLFGVSSELIGVVTDLGIFVRLAAGPANSRERRPQTARKRDTLPGGGRPRPGSFRLVKLKC